MSHSPLARLAAARPLAAPEVGAGDGASYDGPAFLRANDDDLAALDIYIDGQTKHASYGMVDALDGCPYSQDHTDGAFRVQFASGYVDVQCQHNRCKGKHLKDYPDLFPRSHGAKAQGEATSRANVILSAGGHSIGPNTPGAIGGNAGDASPSADAARTLPPAPSWVTGILPGDLERYVDSQARSIGVPPDMIAVPLLVFAGGVIGNTVRLQLKPTWNVFPILWAGVIGNPAGKKSPTLQAAQWPINELQSALHDRYLQQKAEYDAEKQESGNPSGLLSKLEHVFTTDATMEALVRILTDSRGASIIKDELSGFIGGMNKYRSGKGGDDRQNYLSLWAGTPVKADRVTGGTVYVKNPVVGVYGGIQPDRAKDLHSTDGSRDGMVERFLLYWPEVARTGWTDDTVNPDLVGRVSDLFAMLRRITPPANDSRITVHLNMDAKRAFIDWYNQNDDAIGRVSGLRQGYYGKLDSQVARTALILHCLHNPDDPRVMLSEPTMLAALEIVEFFRGHLDRVLPLIGDRSAGDPVGLPARVLRHLNAPDAKDDAGWVSRSTLYSRLRNVSADALTAALEELARSHRVDTRTVSTATKPVEQWRARRDTGSSFSHYSHNSPHPSPDGGENANNPKMKNVYELNPAPDPLPPTGTDGLPEWEV